METPDEQLLAAIDHMKRRVVDLETRYLHMERMFEALDQVARDQQRQIDGMRGKLAALERAWSTIEGSAREPLKPEDEKPPHY